MGEGLWDGNRLILQQFGELRSSDDHFALRSE